MPGDVHAPNGDDVRAKLRSSIRRLLVKHRYPPDKQPAAIKLVLEQMEAMAPRTRSSATDLRTPPARDRPVVAGQPAGVAGSSTNRPCRGRARAMVQGLASAGVVMG
jgi:hypothetical protein